MCRCILLVMLVAGWSFSMPGEACAVAMKGNSGYCYYLAGIALLNNDRSDNESSKAQKYLQLCALTGVTAVTARTFIEKYKNKPDQWQTILATIATILGVKQ